MDLVHVAAPVHPVMLIVLVTTVGNAVKIVFSCAADSVLYCISIVVVPVDSRLLACMVIVASLSNLPDVPWAVNTDILAVGKLMAVNCSQYKNADENVTDAASRAKVVAIIVCSE